MYEFEVPGEYLRPGADACQRVFVLLDASIQLNQPVVFEPVQEGWWYVDLVRIEEADDRIAIWDEYIDVIVGPAGHPYRLLDLDEFGEAVHGGMIPLDRAIESLKSVQAFLDRHLNRRHEVEVTWPDFPPSAIMGLDEIPISKPNGWETLLGRG